MVDIDEIQKFRVIYKLKDVYRMGPVGSRKESCAEHSWSSMMLADLLIPLVKRPLNKMHVFELLLYHDMVRIESGDFPLMPGQPIRDKSQLEHDSMQKLASQLPMSIRVKAVVLFGEYEGLKSPEARFCKCIDVFDPEIHFLDYKSCWKGWSSAFLRSKRQHYFKEFPELLDLWESFLQFCDDEGYFSQ